MSLGTRKETDIATIASMLDGCVSVAKTDAQLDRLGVDYAATLRGGAQVLIDAKAREKGAKRYWKDGPDVALETWSVCPSERNAGKKGWTLCQSKQTDFILFTFDPIDTDEVFLVSYQLLRTAFARHKEEWMRRFKHARQSSGGWTSECVFVPWRVVEQALLAAQRGRMPQAEPESRAKEKVSPTCSLVPEEPADFVDFCRALEPPVN